MEPQNLAANTQSQATPLPSNLSARLQGMTCSSPNLNYELITYGNLPNIPENLRICPVCQVDFAPGVLVMKTSCEHYFHYNCGLRALMVSTGCAMCRASLIPALLVEREVERSIQMVAREIQRVADANRSRINSSNHMNQEPVPGSDLPGPNSQPGNLNSVQISAGMIKAKKGQQCIGNLLVILESQYNYYTPPKGMTSLKFSRQLLNKRKKMFKKEQLLPISHMERYRELTLKRLYSYLLTNVPEFLDYVPDDRSCDQLSKPWLCNIANTLTNGGFDAMRLEAIQNSKIDNKLDLVDREISVDSEFANIMNNPTFPFTVGALASGLQRHRDYADLNLE
jgi:hypothetical protein